MAELKRCGICNYCKLNEDEFINTKERKFFYDKTKDIFICDQCDNSHKKTMADFRSRDGEDEDAKQDRFLAMLEARMKGEIPTDYQITKPKTIVPRYKIKPVTLPKVRCLEDDKKDS